MSMVSDVRPPSPASAAVTSVLDAVAAPILVTDRQGAIVQVNAAFIAQNGYDLHEVIGRTPNLLKSGLTDPAVYARLWHTIFAGRIFRGEVVNRRKDGTTYIADITIVPQFDSDGVPCAFVATHHDITEQRQIDLSLRRSEASFRTVVERSPDAILVHREGTLLYANPAACAYLGYSDPVDLIDLRLASMVYPDDGADIGAVPSLIELGEQSLPREQRFVRKDGAILTADVTALPIVFAGATAVAIVARDVGVRRELAAKMIAMDRMITVGTLAAGVGHEINNPLAYVITNLDFIETEIQTVSDSMRWDDDRSGGPAAFVEQFGSTLKSLAQAASEARDGAQRVRRIVRDLKQFSRMEEDKRESITLAPLLESAISMAWNEIRHRARLLRDFRAAPPVEASAARLGQVFLNLLVNAAQAIPEGHADENQIRVSLFTSESGSAVVEVEDTGGGIPPAVLGRIFVPFFTTKPVGQGTGLGLSISQGLVHRIGGQLEVESEFGKGTTFRVTIPPAPTSETRPAARAPARQSSHRARILVVDDEPLLGRSLRRLLGVDHDVTIASSGREALDRLERSERFDMILCDLMMPEMTGMDLYDAITRLYPAQARLMVFATGGAFTPGAQQFIEQVPNRCLEKPIDIRDIRTLIAETMAAAGHPTS
ncbi:MAG: PAS domain S-box protein [Deltaproteobacteria bacterium]